MMTKLALSLLFLSIINYATYCQNKAKYEPPDGYVYHGVGWNYNNSIPNYLQMMPDSKQPLLFQSMNSLPGTRDMTVEKVLGGLQPAGMDTEKQYIEYGVHFQDKFGANDSVFFYTNTLDSYIDTMVIGFKQFGKPFFLRIGGEMNGDWNGYSEYTFPLAFRKLVEGLRANGVDNFATIWCYEPDAAPDFADSNYRGWKWYPGDDVVDWFGLDVFSAQHFDPAEPDTFRGELSRKGKSELFLKFASERGKPVYLNETTAHSENITPDSADIDSIDGKSDWDHWFVPFFQFIDNHPQIKAFNYINLDWTPIAKWTHWGDCRLEINSYIKEHWIDTLSESKFLHAGYDITHSVSIPDFASDKLNNPTIAVYPNPFNDEAIIEFPNPDKQEYKLVMSNLNGEVVKVVYGINSSHVKIQIGQLPNGFYIFEVIGEKYYIEKVILQR